MNGYKKDYKLETKFFQHRDLREMLRWCGETYQDKTAFITKIRSKESKDPVYINTSYKEFFEEMVCVGTALVAHGMKDARIGVVGENSFRWILAYAAAGCGAGVTVPLDPLLQEDELLSCIERADIRCLFYDRKHQNMVNNIANSGKVDIRLYVLLDWVDEKPEGDRFMLFKDLSDEGKAMIEEGDRSYLDAEIDPEVMSFLLFTSGTTSKSKAVMLSHKNLMSCNWGMNCEELFFPDDVNMMILPLHHIYGFSGLLTFLSQGLTNCFTDGLKYIVKNMKEYGVSVIMSVPLLLESMYKKILQGIEKQGKMGQIQTALKICAASDKVGINLRQKLFKAIINNLGGRMRFIINGAAALDPVVQKGLNEFGILTVQGYGLTETSPTIASETYRYLRPGSVGKVMPNVEARIEDPDEEGIGELVVRGDNVMLGYYNDPEATAEVMEEDGWFHTGDLARFDEDGYLFICGRKKNVIVMKNGKNVFPEEIENIINMLPYVSESILVTRNKANDFVLWIKAVVDEEYKRENGLSDEELEARFDKDMEEINAQLPSYKVIKRWFLSDIPTIKTTTRKTKRHEEKKQIEKEIEERGLK